MHTALARLHQLHGLQPVLPVPDVAAAAAWFRDMLGFRIEFMQGDPPVHARVQLGDRSWGDPLYIHLSRSSSGLPPTSELRMHVGHDLDGLHAHVKAAGATVLQPPADQPWGLREFVVEGPARHRLVLCGYLGEPDAAHSPRSVIAAYRAKPGQAGALLELVRGHVPALQRLGLATDRAPFLMQAADGTLIEVFEWASAAAIRHAHADPQVQALWARFAELCNVEALAALPESAGPFAEFQTL